ncbi:hypothetical protein FACS1894217_09700 [Clostridia bacterium]|nr:hypothetical protein FACS1894217_09700 [Clostridia bacterium]
MTIHALRHTYATTALNSGVAAQNVARLLAQYTVMKRRIAEQERVAKTKKRGAKEQDR